MLIADGGNVNRMVTQPNRTQIRQLCGTCVVVVVKKTFRLRNAFLPHNLCRHPFLEHYYDLRFNYRLKPCGS